MYVYRDYFNSVAFPHCNHWMAVDCKNINDQYELKQVSQAKRCNYNAMLLNSLIH